jgi:acyl carrier protein
MMERSEILDKVTQIIRKVVRCGDKPITPDIDLITELGADSMDMMEIAVHLEKTFHFTVDTVAEVNLRRVDELVDLVERHQEPKGNAASP